MTNTFVTWLLGAAIAGLALVLFLGTPAANSTAVEPSTVLTSNGAAPAPQTASYWHDATATSVSTSAPASAVLATPASGAAPSAVPCPACSTKLTDTVSLVTPPAAVAAAPVGLTGGCGSPSAPCAQAPCGPLAACGRPSCPVCGASRAHASRGVAPCGHPACGHATCAVSTCGTPSCEHACPAPVCDDRPRINRNGPSCVDECAFIQLYSTIPLPVCAAVRFAWAATRGEFLDPYSPTPVYFAPSTGFPGGEEVLVTLTVTDAQGNKYSDQVQLHVNDVR